MNITVQVVTTTDDGQESIRELACIEREELTAARWSPDGGDRRGLCQSTGDGTGLV